MKLQLHRNDISLIFAVKYANLQMLIGERRMER